MVLSLGVNWPVMAVALRSFPPLWLTALRFIVATGVFVAVVGGTSRLHRPSREDLPIVLSTALIRLIAVHALTFLGLMHVPAGRSSIVVYTAGLWVVPMAVLILGERSTLLRRVGLIVGLTGVVVLMEPWSFDWSARDVVVGHAILLITAILSAAFTVHVRGHRFRSSPLTLMPWECAIAAITAVVIAWVVEGGLDLSWTTGAILNVLYQGAFGSGLAIWALVVVARALPAVSTNIGMMGVPCVGLLSSAIVLSERVTPLIVASLLLIGLGVVLAAVSDWRPAEVPVT